MPEQSKPSSVNTPITPDEFEVALLKLKALCEGLCYGEAYSVLRSAALTQGHLVRWMNVLAGAGHALDMMLSRFAMHPPAFPRSVGDLQANRHTPINGHKAEE